MEAWTQYTEKTKFGNLKSVQDTIMNNLNAINIEDYSVLSTPDDTNSRSLVILSKANNIVIKISPIRISLFSMSLCDKEYVYGKYDNCKTLNIIPETKIDAIIAQELYSSVNYGIGRVLDIKYLNIDDYIDTINKFEINNSILGLLFDTIMSYYTRLRYDTIGPEFQISFSEAYQISLSDYISHLSVNFVNAIKSLKIIIMQVYYIMASIKKIYPRFRHYDLHPGNIMLKINATFGKDQDDIYDKYIFNKIIFYLPYQGFSCKCIDFGFSILPEKNMYSSSFAIENGFPQPSASYSDEQIFILTLFMLINKQDNADEIINGLKDFNKISLDYSNYMEKRSRSINNIIPNNLYFMNKDYKAAISPFLILQSNIRKTFT